MDLIGLTEEQVGYIMGSIDKNPNEWNSRPENGGPLTNHKEELRSWLLVQVKEQREGGEWRRRLREQGYTA